MHTKANQKMKGAYDQIKYCLEGQLVTETGAQ